jgi:sec-independent protein translocase protein TatC
VLIIAAIVTPPDFVSQITVAIPMLIIYEASIWISAIVVRNKKRDEQTSKGI